VKLINEILSTKCMLAVGPEPELKQTFDFLKENVVDKMRDPFKHELM